jgi:hypothetical protein
MNHIDLSTVLRQTVACDLYSNLVTRPTGAAVRGQIERLLSDTREQTLTVIDFSQVSMIDFSCADEVIAKLLLRYCAKDPPREAFFLFRGVTEEHWEAIEAVLERHALALAIEYDDGVQVAGVLSENERHAWNGLYRLGRADAEELSQVLGWDEGEARTALDNLLRRRLVIAVDDGYVPVGTSWWTRH